MRHLLVFLGKRLLSNPTATSTAVSVEARSDPKGKGKSKALPVEEEQLTDRGEKVAGEVMNDVLKMIIGAKMDTNPASSSGANVSFPTRLTPLLRRAAHPTSRLLARFSRLIVRSPAVHPPKETDPSPPRKRPKPQSRARIRNVHQERSSGGSSLERDRQSG
jgi:hypothetical protein